MSHHRTKTGRPYVECDENVQGERCRRRTYGQSERFTAEPTSELTVWDLPRGWSVAPFPDDFDHGKTRRSWLDGSTIQPWQGHVGITGDLHTCPACARRMGANR